MQIDHILYQLLLQHECIIVPNFGGFIVRESPCNFNVNKDVLKPYAKSVFFNPHLIENDGLLINAIVKTENVSYTEASEILEKWIANLNRDIDETGKTNIAKIGSFYKGNDHGRWFTADPNLNLALETYGLRPLKVAAVNHNTVETEEPKIIYKPLADNKPIESTELRISKWKAWVAAASIALVAHIGYLTIEKKTTDNTLNAASVIPAMTKTDIKPAETVQDETPSEETAVQETVAEQAPEATIQQDAPQVETTPEEIKPVTTPEPVVITETEPATAVTEAPDALTTEKVIAKYRMEQNAIFHQKDLAKSGTDATVRKNATGLFEVVVISSGTN